MSTNLPVKAHASLGASVAARWMACPGSVNLSRDMPNVESEHARQGTAAHALAEMSLRRGREPETWLGDTVEGCVVDEEMVEAVRVFVDYCRQRTGGDLKHWIEQKFDLAAFNPPAQMFGTADFVSYNPDDRTLEVVDYKNGSGVVVEAKGNKQLRYYALGALVALGAGIRVDRIIMTIVQPRAFHSEGVVRSDHCDYLELLAFAAELLQAAQRTLPADAPLNAGAHCRFCPASPVCPAQRDAAQSLAQVEFEAMPLDVPPNPEALPVEVLGEILTKVPILEDWIRSLHAHAQALLEKGVEVPGFKLVEKRKTRKWADPAQAEAWAKEKGLQPEEMYDMELRSVAQLEKVVGKKNLPGDLVVSRSSGYTMAPASDKRPAVALSPADDFAALPSAEN